MPALTYQVSSSAQISAPGRWLPVRRQVNTEITPTSAISGTNWMAMIVFSGSASDPIIWLGNGYGASGTSGTWTGSITLIGVNAVPAPGAIALLAAAGFAGRRRRA